MFVARSNNGWVVQAPAKINLALEVLGRQSDGYHQVETLLVPVRLYDTLVFTPSECPLKCSVRGARNYSFESISNETNGNLAVIAINRLAKLSGRQATGRVDLFKRIPMQAGMGGGSSDAAAALVAANQAWGLGYSAARLATIAAEIGTDVPFFLQGGAGLGTGRGEQVTPVRCAAGLPLVLVQPPAGLSTPKVFSELGHAPGARLARQPGRCRKLVEYLERGAPIAAWRHLIHNCLQSAATKLCTWIGRIADAMSRLPVVAHQMTGSGSGYFAVCRTWRDAQRVASRLRGQPWQFVVATQTCL